MRSILQALDANMMADAFGIPADLAKKMQREDDRGFIVKVLRESIRMIIPTERKEWRRRESSDNGMEEIYCNMKIHHFLDNPMEADVFSKQTGHLNFVNMFKLPILQYISMSIEKGNLKLGVSFGPHWSVNAHTVVYVTRGRGRTQIVSDEGKTIFDKNVKSGDVFVIPQYFASIHRAGNNGAEWVAFKTSPSAMRSPMTSPFEFNTKPEPYVPYRRN
ncbi:11S globulin seed storage protein 2-like [Wolffia australiana]